MCPCHDSYDYSKIERNFRIGEGKSGRGSSDGSSWQRDIRDNTFTIGYGTH